MEGSNLVFTKLKWSKLNIHLPSNIDVFALAEPSFGKAGIAITRILQHKTFMFRGSYLCLWIPDAGNSKGEHYCLHIFLVNLSENSQQSTLKNRKHVCSRKEVPILILVDVWMSKMGTEDGEVLHSTPFASTLYSAFGESVHRFHESRCVTSICIVVSI